LFTRRQDWNDYGVCPRSNGTNVVNTVGSSWDLHHITAARINKGQEQAVKETKRSIKKEMDEEIRKEWKKAD